MSQPPAANVTEILLAWRGGDAAALDRLLPVVYIELRLTAHRHMREERPDHPLHEALGRLARVSPRKERVVELRYFGGLSVEETAEALGVSEITVMRDWKMAKLWLYQELSAPEVAPRGTR